jgi:deoxyribose-phosphate aldolase
LVTSVTVSGDNARNVSPARFGSLSSFIDYTLLRADARAADVEQLCREAMAAQFAAVCVNGGWVRLAREQLGDSSVQIVSVVSFPLGAGSTSAKVAETKIAIESGADEIDMVMSLGHLIGGDVDYVVNDVTAVVETAGGRVVKVILETAALDREGIRAAASAAKRAGASMVKTSTGFHPRGGATIESVTLLRSVVGDAMGVKASGGIRDVETAHRMIEAGATRIGTSTLLI